MTTQFKPLSNEKYVIPKAQILFRPLGQDAFELLGDADDVEITPEVEETERYSNEGGVRLLAKTVVTQVDATLAMTLVQFSDRNRALALLGELEFETQAAAPGHTMTLVGPDHAEKIYPLEHFNVSNVVVTDGAGVPVPYVLDVNYKVDVKAGFIQLLSEPGGADGDVVIEYDAPAVVSGDGIAKIGLANQTENRGTIVIRGTNDVGPKVMLQLHDVQIRPSGGRSYISDTDFATIEVEGRVFRDDTQPSGFELGFERSIPA